MDARVEPSSRIGFPEKSVEHMQFDQETVAIMGLNHVHMFDETILQTLVQSLLARRVQ